MRKIWAVLTWSPLAKMPWHAKLFNTLWCWALVYILFGWWDSTVHFDTQITEDDIPGYVQEPPEDWTTPLDLGHGLCLQIEPRKYVSCS